MKFLKTLLLFTFLFAYQTQNAQEQDTKMSLDDGTISSQFDFISKKSGNYRAAGVRYEVVKESHLYKLRKNVLDSINLINGKTAGLNATISGHETTISSLNKKLEETTNNLSKVTEEKDSMAFLGILVSKATYRVILWTIVIVLLILLFVFIYRFRRSNILTQEAKVALSEVEKEYEDHRRRALEREQKISRQLQDEINKQKKIK